MNWVLAFGFTLGAIGLVALLTLIPYALFRKDKERTEEQRRVLAWAVEDERDDPGEDERWPGSHGDCPICGNHLAEWECELIRLRSRDSTPDEVDPPVTRPYIRCDHPSYLDRWES